MSLIEQILAWANDQHKWQQKAIRLLLAKEELTDEEVQELVTLCKAEHGMLDGAAVPEVLSLTTEEVNVDAAGGQVTLLGVAGTSNVNALMQGAAITFGKGLTIVYGDNASGKSGFCRLLKNICRARHPEAVLPNVRTGINETPSATIHYAIDGVEQEPFTWTSGDPPSLLSVSVFDSKCATVYVESENDVAYRPLGLDVFDRLAIVCGRMEAVMKKEVETLEAKLEDFSEMADAGTEVGKMLLSLSAGTKLGDITKLAMLSEAELNDIDRLKREIALLAEQDPQQKSKMLTARKGRIVRLTAHISSLVAAFSAVNVEQLRLLKTEAETAKAAAKLASEQAFQGTLPGVGGDVWKKLWEAARQYSAQAYPGQEFPVTSSGAVCVTCQQPLSEDARKRIQSFEDFVKMEAQRTAEKAVEDYARAKVTIFSTKISPEDWENLSGELEPELTVELEAFLTSVWERKAHIFAALQRGDWEALPNIPLSPEERLKTLTNSIAGEIQALQPANPEFVAKTKATLAELTARQQLQKQQAKVIQHIERLADIQKLRGCIRKTATNGISNQSTLMTKGAITEPFYNAFQKELTAIGLPIGAEFVHVRSKKGMPYHQIVLKGHDDMPVKLETIASESEHLCLALSGFLTELTTASNASAIIFDDPVSSLDHLRRDVIAKRIVQESLQRQVIVFSHDLVFVRALADCAEAVGVEPTYRHIRRGSKGFGMCHDELSYSRKSLKKRLGQLRDKYVQAKVAHDKDEHDSYEQQGEYIYGLLRDAWEQAIEEVLLGGAMERFKEKIETQKLKEVDVLPGDYQIIEENMAKCSTWLPGHYISPAINTPFPSPEELQADINVLDEWVSSLKSRRKKDPTPSPMPKIEAAVAAMEVN